MRLAILGGSFNPPHIGHIELARFVLDNCPVFEEIWLMPCWKNVEEKGRIDYEYRYQMCKLAAAGYPIKVSKFEYEHNIGSTYELLEQLEKFYGETFTVHMIIGMDAANNISNWKNAKELVDKFKFIVVDRCPYKASKKEWYMKSPHVYLKDRYANLPAASSTTIRNKVEGWKNLLRPSVLAYMVENKLYE